MTTPENVESYSPKVDTMPPPTATPTMPAPTAPPGVATGDVENPSPPPPPPPPRGTDDTGVKNIVRRWKREDLLKKGSMTFRGTGLIFSLLAFIITASNNHGDWKDYSRYEEYRYVLAIAILSTFYTGFQVFRQVRELSTGIEMFPRRKSMIVDFFGDQIAAYLLLSSASSAVPLTNRMREGADNIFSDTSATAISMQFFAFIALALSALISGFKLSNQPYI